MNPLILSLLLAPLQAPSAPQASPEASPEARPAPAPQVAPAKASPEASAPSSAGFDDAILFYSAGLEQLMSDPRDRGLVRTLGKLDRWITVAEEESGEPAPAVARMLASWILRPLSLRGGVTPEGLPSGQLDVAWPDRTTALSELAKLRGALEQEGMRLVASESSVGAMSGNTPVGPLSVEVQSGNGRAVLSVTLGRDRAPGFERPALPLPTGVDPAFAFRIEGGAFADLIAAGLAAEGEDGKLAARILEELGLAGDDAMTFSLASGHGASEAITTTLVEGFAKTLLGRAQTSRLSKQDFALLPDDTQWCWMGNFSAKPLFELARMIEPEQVDGALKMAALQVGFDLERDLLGRIGPLVGAFTSTGTGGAAAGPGGLVLFARCDEPKRVLASIEKLLGVVGQMGAQMQGAQVEPRKWKHADTVCTSLTFPGAAMPFEPTYAVRGDVLYIAGNRGGMMAAIDQAVNPATSIVDHPRLDQLPDGALGGLVSFGFSDAPKALEQGYGALGMLQAALSNGLQSAGASPRVQGMMPSVGDLFPSYTELARGARPSVTLGYLRGDDLFIANTHDRSYAARMAAAAGSSSFSNPMLVPIVASVAIPKLLSARVSANEAAAIATLRSFASAQAQFKEMGALDGNGDGEFEYALLGELSAARPLRGTGEVLRPALLSDAFGELRRDGCNGAVVQRSGYYFQMWLPGGTGAVSDPEMEGPVPVDPTTAATHWRAYAWPVEPGNTGVRAFYVDERAQVHMTANQSMRPYHSLCTDGGRQPSFDSASERRGRFDSYPPAHGGPSSDSERWQPVE